MGRLIENWNLAHGLYQRHCSLLIWPQRLPMRVGRLEKIPERSMMQPGDVSISFLLSHLLYLRILIFYYCCIVQREPASKHFVGYHVYSVHTTKNICNVNFWYATYVRNHFYKYNPISILVLPAAQTISWFCMLIEKTFRLKVRISKHYIVDDSFKIYYILVNLVFFIVLISKCKKELMKTMSNMYEKCGYILFKTDINQIDCWLVWSQYWVVKYIFFMLR